MANNQNVNKVVYDGTTLIDVTDTTAEASDVVSGKVFTLKSGAKATGTLVTTTYTEGTGIDITNDIISNTAPMFIDEMGTYSGATPINADLLEGNDASYFENLPIKKSLVYTAASTSQQISTTTIDISSLVTDKPSIVNVQLYIRASTNPQMVEVNIYSSDSYVVNEQLYYNNIWYFLQRELQYNFNTNILTVGQGYSGSSNATNNRAADNSILIPYKIFVVY